jgi:hypothetical protein
MLFFSDVVSIISKTALRTLKCCSTVGIQLILQSGCFCSGFDTIACARQVLSYRSRDCIGNRSRWVVRRKDTNRWQPWVVS